MINTVMVWLITAVLLAAAFSLLTLVWKGFRVRIAGKELEGKHLQMSRRYYQVTTVLWAVVTLYGVMSAAVNPDRVFTLMDAASYVFVLALIYAGVLVDLGSRAAERLEQRLVDYHEKRGERIPDWHPENDDSK